MRFFVGSYSARYSGDTRNYEEHYYNVGDNVVHRYQDNGRSWFVAMINHTLVGMKLHDDIKLCLRDIRTEEKMLEGNGCDAIRSEKVSACIKKLGSIICVKNGHELRTSRDRGRIFYTANFQTWPRSQRGYGNYAIVKLIVAQSN